MADPAVSLTIAQLAGFAASIAGVVSTAAAGTIKLVLNGSAGRIKDIQADVKEIKQEQINVRERVAKIEGALQ